MRNRLSAAAAFTATVMAAAPAFAGNLGEPVVQPAPAIAVAMPIDLGGDWTGFYAGGQLGYADVTGSGTTADVDGAIYGVHGGYMYDLGSVVLGGEVDYDLSSIDNVAGTADLDDIMRVKARVGYDAGAFLPYVTGGVVRANTSGPDLEVDGDFYGLGVAYKYADNIVFGGEVLQHKFYEGDAATLTDTLRATTATARVSYQF